MAGYSRQSVADIVSNAIIKAAPVNAEYNAIRDAFAFAGVTNMTGVLQKVRMYLLLQTQMLKTK
jgi:hypothetical protein